MIFLGGVFLFVVVVLVDRRLSRAQKRDVDE